MHSIAPHPILTPQPSVDSLRRPWLQSSLTRWRTDVAKSLAVDCGFAFPHSIVMPDEYLNLLARWGSHIKDIESMLRFAGHWTEINTYGDAVLKILEHGREMSVDGANSPRFQSWMEANSKTKRQRLYTVKQASTAQSQEEIREERRNAWMIAKGCLPPRQPAVPPTCVEKRCSETTVEWVLNTVQCPQKDTSLKSPRARQTRVTSPVSVAMQSPGGRREPLVDRQASQTPCQIELPDSSFGRKRRRPAHLGLEES
jgi:hypothetical protein